jgi:uncharacterized protein (TIGR00725 family)
MQVNSEPVHNPERRHGLYVSVIGGGRCTAEEYSLAEAVGSLVAQQDAILVCGGLSGVMEAAARGAKEAGGSTVGILPGTDRVPGNPYLDVVICSGVGHARNLAVVSTGDVVIAIGGGYGTLSEIGLALKIGRPVIVLEGWRLQRDQGTLGIVYASTPQEAIALALEAFKHVSADGSRDLSY